MFVDLRWLVFSAVLWCVVVVCVSGCWACVVVVDCAFVCLFVFVCCLYVALIWSLVYFLLGIAVVLV